jgi:hypothetical protein
MIRIALALLLAISLGGCASLWYAGESDYSVTLTDGVTITIHSGKEAQSVNAMFAQTPTGYVITLQETGVEAFNGQAQAASVASDVAAAVSNTAISAAKILK